MFKWIYHASRIIFGGWWLYSGLMHFIDKTWQPYGEYEAAIKFTTALVESGLFEWIKIIEVILGITILANRAMPLTIIALVPINIIIIYWNFVLDPGTVQIVFGWLSILFNAIIVWPWRRYFWPLFVWSGKEDYSMELGLPGSAKD